MIKNLLKIIIVKNVSVVIPNIDNVKKENTGIFGMKQNYIPKKKYLSTQAKGRKTFGLSFPE